MQPCNHAAHAAMQSLTNAPPFHMQAHLRTMDDEAGSSSQRTPRSRKGYVVVTLTKEEQEEEEDRASHQHEDELALTGSTRRSQAFRGVSPVASPSQPQAPKNRVLDQKPEGVGFRLKRWVNLLYFPTHTCAMYRLLAS